jgi:DNA polymerase-3 subunit gamma/tau
MSYVVLARKWRPQTFADLTGQEHVAQTLGNALQQNRVPHAMLFTGARGVGKTSSARILAMALNCVQGPTTTPCGVCPACVETQQGSNMDVLEIDGASNRGIGEIRELRDSVRYAPGRDRYKVYIIDEVHMLTTEAFNALLKTLEEPPAHVVFVLATTEAHKIPVTILSRCQRFDFRRIPHNQIVERLQQIVDAEGIRADIDVLGLVARQAAGGMRDALSLLDQIIAFAGTDITMTQAASILGAAERRRLFDLTGAMIGRDAASALSVIDGAVAFGVNLPHFASELVEHLRDLTVLAAGAPSSMTMLTESELALAREQLAMTDQQTLHRMFEVAAEGAEQVSRSNYARLVMDMAVVRMCSMEPMSSVDDILAMVSRLAGGEALERLPASARMRRSARSVPTTADESESEEPEPAHALPVPVVPVAKSTVVAPPAVETPIVDASIVDEPVVDPPVAEADAVAEKPVVEKPVVEKPVAEADAVEAPDEEPPVAEAVVSAPALVPNAPADVTEPGTESSPTVDDEAPSTTASTPHEIAVAAWPRVIRILDSTNLTNVASLMRVAYLLPIERPGILEVALEDDFARRVRSDEVARVGEALREAGAALEFELVTTVQAGDQRVQDAFQLAHAEEERKAIRLRMLHEFVTSHDVTQMIMKTLPGSRIRTILPTEDMSMESTDEQA